MGSLSRAFTILIVEDNEVTRTGLVKVLEQAGYSTASAANGLEALEYLRSHPPPNLVLLDMFLPLYIIIMELYRCLNWFIR